MATENMQSAYLKTTADLTVMLQLLSGLNEKYAMLASTRLSTRLARVTTFFSLKKAISEQTYILLSTYFEKP